MRKKRNFQGKSNSFNPSFVFAISWYLNVKIKKYINWFFLRIEEEKAQISLIRANQSIPSIPEEFNESSSREEIKEAEIPNNDQSIPIIIW